MNTTRSTAITQFEQQQQQHKKCFKQTVSVTHEVMSKGLVCKNRVSGKGEEEAGQ